MKTRIYRYLILLLFVTLMFALACNDGESESQNRIYQMPRLLENYELKDDDFKLEPVCLRIFDDTLYISYRRVARIDMYTLDMEFVRSIHLTDSEPVVPSSFALSDSMLVVSCHSKGMIILYDYLGKLITSFGTLPDGTTNLLPLSLTCFREIAYICDLGIRQIMAVALRTEPGITEQGELIITIPGDSNSTLGMPLSIYATPDGRLLVGDARDNKIRVFTCDGRYVYDFDSVPMPEPIIANDFALDDISDLSLQDDSSADPSGVRSLGRFHVLDSHNGKIHLYNAIGKYISSYPEQNLFLGASSIAIDTGVKRIYIADPVNSEIIVLDYED